MSTPIYRIPAKVRALLRERGSSVHQLAVAVRLPVRRVQWALSGHPRRRRRDRLQLIPFLGDAELAELAWWPEIARSIEAGAPVSRGTFQMQTQ